MSSTPKEKPPEQVCCINSEVDSLAIVFYVHVQLLYTDCSSVSLNLLCMHKLANVWMVLLLQKAFYAVFY